MANVGFIGLGIMGSPMAKRLIEAGNSVVVRSRRAAPADLLALGARELASIAEVAKAADIIILMLPDTPDVELVLFGEGGVADALTPGKLVIDMSSICPLRTKEFAARIEAKGCQYLDAPVSGGEVGAKASTLTIMVGGPQSAFERALPLLQSMGQKITLIGGNGDGQTCKVANQIVVALNIEAVSEALVFAAKAGADPAKVREALMGGFAASRILEVHGERMLKRTFNPGFRIALHQKDLSLALSGARTLGVSLPNTATAQALFTSCEAHGEGQSDHSGMIRALERMANHPIG